MWYHEKRKTKEQTYIKWWSTWTNIYDMMINKVIAAEGEHKASRALKHAADVLMDNSGAMQVRFVFVDVCVFVFVCVYLYLYLYLYLYVCVCVFVFKSR